MNWQAFAATAPQLAALGERRFERAGLALVGTLRRDGWPRINPVEPFIVGGELLLGMMWRSRKALDLMRDSRLSVHSATCDPKGVEGDFKIFGRAVEVSDPGVRQRYADAVEAQIKWRPREPYHLFSVDIESAAFVIFGTERFGLRWNSHRGLEHWAIPAP